MPNLRSVLVVEDYVLQLNAWVRALSEEGMHVLPCSTAADALQLAREHRPQVAIVDLFLGADDALECVRALKGIDPTIRVVVVSGDMSVAYAMAAIRAGADDVRVKPLAVVEVVNQLASGTEPAKQPERQNLTLDEIEWEHISRVLLETNKNITQAAERLGIYRQTLQRKLRKRSRDRLRTY